ncbi:hypothetical protein [Xanthovirga aplysinae]|uniref:hypothetical protein n=1 Tax=Xanthovirga aplysinae TaxID=2529853 RepID=UPI0012BB72F0|nr:hypothetical protein [Xanthovirga aplysinae]MTI33120.1 hypothetical protein [Xanthovirga aplysinae]
MKKYLVFLLVLILSSFNLRKVEEIKLGPRVEISPDISKSIELEVNCPAFDFYGPSFLKIGENAHYVLFSPEDLNAYGVTKYYWSISDNNVLRFNSSVNNQIDVFVEGVSSGSATLTFHAEMSCGTTKFTFPLRVQGTTSDDDGPGSGPITPTLH